MSPIPPNVGIL